MTSFLQLWYFTRGLAGSILTEHGGILCPERSAATAGNGSSHLNGDKEAVADQLLGPPVSSGRVFGTTFLALILFGKSAIFATSIIGDYRPLLPSLQGEHYHKLLSLFLPLTAYSLPGTPLWVISVYSSSLAPLTKYWIPAFW